MRVSSSYTIVKKRNKLRQSTITLGRTVSRNFTFSIVLVLPSSKKNKTIDFLPIGVRQSEEDNQINTNETKWLKE